MFSSLAGVFYILIVFPKHYEEMAPESSPEVGSRLLVYGKQWARTNHESLKRLSSMTVSVDRVYSCQQCFTMYAG